MKTLIVGGNGFVGSYLSPFLVEKRFDVTIMARAPEREARVPPDVKTLAADATKPGPRQEEISNFDLLSNFTGVSVYKRWDDAHKKLLRDKKILTTRYLVEALPWDAERKITLINISRAGTYGDWGDEELSESALPGSDFLSHLAQDWEAEACKAEQKWVRVLTPD
ncbi:MAG: NAD-dependent epimerase/dehydratase family protein [Desulfomonilaceae bacterium]